ncbi:MAG: prepilin-type N-terminal cleavage/methylation domain-containing protein [Planctomycetes bacterium]|nr:prepilin-type N-terminal cleavage/methylation domain-containing protein [Planctomycetota bacterium]
MGKKAFSLIELVLIVALLAILFSIAIPRMGWDTMGKVQGETAAKQFSDYLKLAKLLAITNASTNGSGYKVVCTVDFSSYRIVNADTSADVKGPIYMPNGVVCTGDTEFQFTPLGELTAGSGTLTLQFTKEGDTTTVTVTQIGRITITG